MQSIKQAVRNIGKNKYSQNLLGESLEELIRKATAKTLEFPDELANAQVCQSITDEQNLTPKDITNILKKRLHTTSSNPQKQWLTIILVGKVLEECQPVVGMHSEELLTEVARIVTKYSRFSRETPAGIRARNAARELLRNSPAGLQAIRHVAREAYITPQAAFGGAGGAGVEKESLKDEVKRMIDCANNLAEVLNEMLVNNGDADLLRELLNDLTELRTYFNVNLEQLMNFPGEDVEAITKEALEAMDALDNTLALQQDVLKQPQDLAPGTTAPGLAAAPAPAAPAPSSSTTLPAPVTAAAPAPAPVKNTVDLLDLLDLSDPVPAAAPAPTSAPPVAQKDPFADPFADLAPLMPTSPTSKPTPIPAPGPANNTYLQQSSGGFNGMQPPVGSPGMTMPPAQNFSPPHQSGFNPAFPSSPVPMPQQYAPQNTGYNSFSPSQQQGYMMNQPGMYNQGYMQQQTGYGMPGYVQPGAQMQGFQSSSNNPFNTGGPGPYSVQSTGTNPFATNPHASVDQEFESIFADRTQPGAAGLASPQQAPPQQQQQQQQQWRF